MSPPVHHIRADREGSASRETGRSRSPGECDLYVVRRQHLWRPPTDVFETDTHIVVKVEIPGMDESDFEVTFADRTIVIAGVRRDPVGKIIYQNMEIRYGRFETRVRVERPLDASSIEADYEQGFLFVRLPKARGRRVPINSSTQGA